MNGQPLHHGAVIDDALQAGTGKGIRCHGSDGRGDMQRLQLRAVIEGLVTDGFQAFGQGEAGKLCAAAENGIGQASDVRRQRDGGLGLVKGCPVLCFLQVYVIGCCIGNGRIDTLAVPGTMPAFLSGFCIGKNLQRRRRTECAHRNRLHSFGNINKRKDAAGVIVYAAVNGLYTRTDYELCQRSVIAEYIVRNSCDKVRNGNFRLGFVQLHPIFRVRTGKTVYGVDAATAAIIVPIGTPAIGFAVSCAVNYQIACAAIEGAVARGCARRNICHRGGEIDNFQSRAVAKRLGAEAGNAIGQAQGFQSRAIVETIVRNTADAGRQVYFRQTGAAVESAGSDGGDAAGNGDACQAGAAFESTGFNGGDGCGDDDVLQSGVALENAAGNAGNARRNLNGFGGLVDAAPEFTFAAEGIIVNGQLVAVIIVIPVSFPAGRCCCQRGEN